MGAPTKSQVEAWSDHIAACVQKDIDGFRAEYAAKTVASLFDLVDASGDPTVEAALLGASIGVDEQSLPEYSYDWLPAVTRRAEYAAWVRALKTLVTGTGGGSYASLRAYLADKSAKMHPLAGEVVRAALGEGSFTSAGVVLGVSNPSYQAIFPTRVYQGADGSLSAETADAQSSSTADVTLFASDDDALYLGSDRPFSAVVIALSTLANVTISPTFGYWNGSIWAPLTVTDNSAGLTKNDAITFIPPSDWTRWYKDAGGTAFADLARLYYVRIARTADTVGTPPVGTCVTLVPTPIYTAAGGTLHSAAAEQPPLALVRITAASTVTVTLPAAIDHTRFAHPIGSEGKIRLRALTPIAQNLTVTLAYVNDDGSNASNAQSSWSAPAALGTKTVALADTDADGLRSVRTATSVSTTATEGVFVVEALPIRTPAV